MRIVMIGQAAFGAKVLEALREKKENVIAVYTVSDKPGGPPDPLKEAADAQGIKLLQPKTYKDDQVFSAYKALAPDLTVMAFVTDIIPERYFNVPALGAINYHPSLLPRHRGGSAINWAVIMGDKKTGLREAHFATFPEDIPSICIKAGSLPGQTVFDPFMGSGTVGVVAKRLMRNYVGIELNPKYIEMAEKRIRNEHKPLLVEGRIA